jgi:hypothetical protein
MDLPALKLRNIRHTKGLLNPHGYVAAAGIFRTSGVTNHALS